MRKARRNDRRRSEKACSNGTPAVSLSLKCPAGKWSVSTHLRLVSMKRGSHLARSTDLGYSDPPVAFRVTSPTWGSGLAPSTRWHPKMPHRSHAHTVHVTRARMCTRPALRRRQPLWAAPPPPGGFAGRVVTLTETPMSPLTQNGRAVTESAQPNTQGARWGRRLRECPHEPAACSWVTRLAAVSLALQGQQAGSDQPGRLHVASVTCSASHTSVTPHPGQGGRAVTQGGRGTRERPVNLCWPWPPVHPAPFHR